MNYLLDTNVLVLLVVGLADPDLIGVHKNTQAFNSAHFDVLFETLSPEMSIVSTPNVLTETSNMLAQIGEPKRSKIMNRFALLIEDLEEIYLPRKAAAKSAHFVRLGLTDAVIANLKKDKCRVLSVDAKLCYACAESGIDALNLTPMFYE